MSLSPYIREMVKEKPYDRTRDLNLENGIPVRV